ncbi:MULTISPECIES: sodium:solute symporter family protein [unclassified Streptomyces]|uniref:Sodium:solute symporter family protein n=1 Tax=Streptomyces evansiae TaxID=3075535 RepID=A0ABU2R7Y0_9ACTN|nr:MULTISPECIES: sodium:solute symporter family protein [unclassified Streptomyces]EFL00490.1 sodium:solute symporter [Streptomyces sp. SPB78]MDT0412813.1 sodium:solute symporter family protein [Streptomyces sp. DSM 41979]MYQ59300.1 sodium/solute symporter [Streptomyces sp. SID4926]MYR24675.1 sodium/solute symporter [Streptomyces sp. SID4945]NJA55446.1 sodium:solute symporter family protein [Streptomyces sp. NEAU-H3]
MYLADGLRLPTNWLDYTILALYFVVVLGIGFAARRSVKTSLDFFLSGRSLPAWVTGLAFVAANLGATEILGMAANGAQYGVYTVHWYWIGAVPAMVFLGLVMMPFYYNSKVRSVPEFLLHRFGKSSHLLSSIIFAVSAVLIAGVNLYAMAIVLEALLGWPQWVAIVVAAAFVLVYITVGGLSSAIYNEVLQFFVILAALIPLTIVGLKRVGGWGGITDKLDASKGDSFLSAWQNTGIGSDNPLGANWLTIVLGLGFVMGFGYWTTNFAEVQRALSAKNLSAAKRTPLIAAFPKIFIPAIVVIPGLIALILEPSIGKQGGDFEFNDAIPLLMRDLLPNGVLGIAVTGLLAAFMAGMAANISSFNTVFTTDIWQPYIKPNMPDAHYLKVGRVITAIGVVIGIGTAFIASGFSNIMNYLQTLFSFFNVPLFVVFIIGMFWKRTTGAAGFWGLLSGTVAAMVNYFWFYKQGIIGIPTDQGANFVSSIVAFVVGAVVMVVVTMVTKPKPAAELQGLVYGTKSPGVEEPPAEGDDAWYRKPALLGWGALILAALCYIPFSL